MPKTRKAKTSQAKGESDRPSLEEAANKLAGVDDSQFDPAVDLDPLDRPAPATRGPDKKPRKPAAEVVEDDEPEAPRHSPRMVEMAGDFGLSDADIASYSPRELEAYVRASQRQLMASHETLRTLPRGEAPRSKPEPEDDGIEELEWGVGEDGKPLTEKEFAALATPLKQVARWRAKDRRELLEARKENKAILDRLNKADERASVVAIEQVFATLPKRVRALVGVGTAATLGKKSAEFQFRMDCIRIAGDRNDPDFAENLRAACIRMASRIAAADDTLEDEEDEYDVEPAAPVNRVRGHLNGERPTEDDYRRGRTARPNSRRERELPPGEEKARHGVAKLLAKKGVRDEDFDAFAGGGGNEERNLPE